LNGLKNLKIMKIGDLGILKLNTKYINKHKK